MFPAAMLFSSDYVWWQTNGQFQFVCVKHFQGRDELIILKKLREGSQIAMRVLTEF
jgi:hypothetical protein